jgi:hypothetical protein
MTGISITTERKHQVLQHIYEVREGKGDPVVKKHNLPIWVDDQQAAHSLVKEAILEGDLHNDDGDCYRAGYRFVEGLRKYGIVSGSTKLR